MSESTSPEARSGARAVERALLVLQEIARSGRELGVSELAERTGLAVSTVHRLVRVLCSFGLARQDPRTDRYQLGPALIPLGRSAERMLGFAGALPALEELARATGESVNLGTRLGDDVLVVLDVASSHPLRFDQAPGSRVPIHSSAMGKCLLAYSGDLDAAVSSVHALPGLTDRTITDRARLRDELERVRGRGWALNDEERNPGVRAVAVPVPDADGIAVAAIAVQGPAVRIDPSRFETVVAALRATARAVGPFVVGAAP